MVESDGEHAQKRAGKFKLFGRKGKRQLKNKNKTSRLDQDEFLIQHVSSASPEDQLRRSVGGTPVMTQLRESTH